MKGCSLFSPYCHVIFFHLALFFLLLFWFSLPCCSWALLALTPWFHTLLLPHLDFTPCYGILPLSHLAYSWALLFLRFVVITPCLLSHLATHHCHTLLPWCCCPIIACHYPTIACHCLAITPCYLAIAHRYFAIVHHCLAIAPSCSALLVVRPCCPAIAPCYLAIALFCSPFLGTSWSPPHCCLLSHLATLPYQLIFPPHSLV
jgi:hypothetical protein